MSESEWTQSMLRFNGCDAREGGKGKEDAALRAHSPRRRSSFLHLEYITNHCGFSSAQAETEREARAPLSLEHALCPAPYTPPPFKSQRRVQGGSARAVDLHQLQVRPPEAASSPPARPRRHRRQNRRCSPRRGLGRGQIAEGRCRRAQAGTGRRSGRSSPPARVARRRCALASKGRRRLAASCLPSAVR